LEEGLVLEAISKIIIGLYFTGEAGEIQTNPLVFEMTSNNKEAGEGLSCRSGVGGQSFACYF
jgi:hypothetical protein